jgi:hypothetical protein
VRLGVDECDNSSTTDLDEFSHRYYKTNPELEEKYISRTFDCDEVVRLNEEVAAPWVFESKKVWNKVNEEESTY